MIIAVMQKGEPMTREEALTEIKERVSITEYVNSSYVDCVDIEALKVAIKTLEQPEPCENAEFWRKRAEYYSKMCLDLIADMNKGVKIDSIEINEEGIKFKKTQPEPQWIPCSKTIDIPDHEVLCCDRRGEELIGWLSYNDAQWFCESNGEMMYDTIAWREKPEPYGGKQDE